MRVRQRCLLEQLLAGAVDVNSLLAAEGGDPGPCYHHLCNALLETRNVLGIFLHALGQVSPL
eukprot:1803173-Pyramimonas_sp.AAC.1